MIVVDIVLTILRQIRPFTSTIISKDFTCRLFMEIHGVLDNDEYRTELFEGGVLQIGVARDGEPHFDTPENSSEYGEKVATYYYWFYPGLMLNFYPWGLSVNQVIPLSVNKTRIVYHGYVGNAEMLGKGAGGTLTRLRWRIKKLSRLRNAMFPQDHMTGEVFAENGRGVHHFHRMLTRNQ